MGVHAPPYDHRRAHSRERHALAGVAKLVRSSHERWDGTGYPDGLAGDKIPLGARIIFVCDAFDAMLAERPDSAALDFESALAELERCAGQQFDPQVVTAFVAVVRARAVNPLDATGPHVQKLAASRL